MLDIRKIIHRLREGQSLFIAKLGSIDPSSRESETNLLSLFERNIQIVIASSEVFYIAPVNSDFKAECCMPVSLEWERFQKIL